MMVCNGEPPMSTTDWAEATRADLFVRSDLPTPARRCRQATTSRLEALVAKSVFEAVSVTSWAKRVPLESGANLGTFERDTFDEFSEWARREGVRLAPFFDTRECHSSTTGERQTQLVLPALCLALYDGEELVGVVPHADEDGTVSIGDCLEYFEKGTGDDRSVTLTAAD